MGALEIRNKKLRCTRCLDIRRLLIIPSPKKPKIEVTCHCNKSVENLLDYCNEIKKVTEIKLVCSKCKKDSIVHPRICYDCLLIYCSKCCDNHLPNKNLDDVPVRASLVGHTTIHVEKSDYYCVDHQNHNFIGYCQQCLMNLCNECIREGTHKFHHVDIFSVIKPSRSDKDQFKNNIKISEQKIESNNKKITNFCKLHKDDKRTKKIEKRYKIIYEENNDILMLLKYSFNLYKSNKMKNYSIIYNVTKNKKFNTKLLDLDKSNSEEEKFKLILKYLKKDALILYKRSKNDQEKFISDNEKENEDSNNDENEENIYSSYNDIDNQNNNEENDEKNYLDDNIILESEEVDNVDNNLNINELQNENNNNKIDIKNDENIIKNENNFQPKKLKIPSIFEQKQQQKMPYLTAKDIPRPKKLKIPTMFEKREEDNKPKERAGIINIGASKDMKQKKDFLSKMMEKKREMGGEIGGYTNEENNNKINKEEVKLNTHIQERNEIIQDNNEGNTEEVINKVVIANKKKKKPKRSQAFGFGEEFIELPKSKPKHEIVEENNEINDIKESNELNDFKENNEISNIKENNENIENQENIENNVENNENIENNENEENDEYNENKSVNSNKSGEMNKDDLYFSEEKKESDLNDEDYIPKEEEEKEEEEEQ